MSTNSVTNECCVERHHFPMIWAKDSATDGGTVTTLATYAYDALSNRIEKDVWTQSSGTTTVTRFGYDGQEIWVDLNGSNALQTRYIDGDAVDELFARISSSGAAAWYLTDSLGSVRDIVNSTGTVLDHIDFDGFGNLTNETSPSNGDRFKWTGRECDSESGLQFNRARYFDPRIGRWNSQDPIGFSAHDANLYRYALNSFVLYVDPSGLWSWKAFGAGFVGGFIAGGVTGGIFSGGNPLGFLAGGLIGGLAGGFAAGNSQNPGNFNGWKAFGAGALVGGVAGAGGVISFLNPHVWWVGIASGAANGAVGAGVASGGNPRAIVIGALIGGGFGAIGASTGDPVGAAAANANAALWGANLEGFLNLNGPGNQAGTTSQGSGQLAISSSPAQAGSAVGGTSGGSSVGGQPAGQGSGAGATGNNGTGVGGKTGPEGPANGKPGTGSGGTGGGQGVPTNQKPPEKPTEKLPFDLSTAGRIITIRKNP